MDREKKISGQSESEARRLNDRELDQVAGGQFEFRDDLEVEKPKSNGFLSSYCETCNMILNSDAEEYYHRTQGHNVVWK